MGASLKLADAPPTPTELYERYSRYIARLGLRLLGRDSDLDDLVQDTFLEASRAMPVFADADQARRWLATVAVRFAFRKLRRRRLATFFGLDDGAHDEHLLSSDASPEARVTVRRLFDTLSRLPARQRLAWTLRHVEGESLDEVARLCDCSLATAKRAIAAAADALGEGES